MIISATGDQHYLFTYLILLFASAGVFHHSGIKIPFFAFFAHDAGFRVKEAPRPMLIAMTAMAVACVVIGIFPGLLYSILPYAVDYHPYTTTHVVTQYQLLLFSALAFTVLKVTGIYPAELRSVNLDVDWIYRKGLPKLIGGVARVGGGVGERLHAVVSAQLDRIYRGIYRLHGPTGVFARTWTTGAIAFWAVVGLFGYLLLYLWGR